MTHPYRSEDGLLSSSDPEAVALWNNLGRQQRQADLDWSARLRAAGVKMAHPDDGWVNRDDNTFVPSYPRFNDDPQVGDLIAFGTPPDGEFYEPRREFDPYKHDPRPHHKRPVKQPESADSGYRICRVTAIDLRRGGLPLNPRYSYEDTGERMPPRAPEPTLKEKVVETLKDKVARWIP